MAEDIKVIKYLDHDGLKALWDKISNTYLRNSNVVDALTTFGEGKIIVSEDGTFIQKGVFDNTVTGLSERIEEVAAAQGTNIDNDTIINVEGKLQTNLLLQDDKDNHILSIVTGAGTSVSTWNYTEFYNEAVKDGILDTVELVVVPSDSEPLGQGREAGTYLKFTFNTSSGKQPLYVNVTDLIDVYEGSTYVKVEKSNGHSTISLDTTTLIPYLKSDEALGITSIIARLEGVEDGVSEIRDLIKSLQESWEGIDLAGLQEQVLDNKAAIEEIQEYLKSVPNTRITEDEINELE